MKWISTTIKRKHLDKILSEEKTIEFKGATPFWMKRLDKLMLYDGDIAINFLCGRESYKFRVEKILYCVGRRVIDGILHDEFYEIHLGEQITKEE